MTDRYLEDQLRKVVQAAEDLLEMYSQAGPDKQPQNIADLIEWGVRWFWVMHHHVPDLAHRVHNLQDYEAGLLPHHKPPEKPLLARRRRAIEAAWAWKAAIDDGRAWRNRERLDPDVRRAITAHPDFVGTNPRRHFAEQFTVTPAQLDLALTLLLHAPHLLDQVWDGRLNWQQAGWAFRREAP
jgi:hypothetical protein